MVVKIGGTGVKEKKKTNVIIKKYTDPKYRWELGIVKDCSESKILCYLQANKLAGHNFIVVGKPHELSGSETKGTLLLTPIVVARVSAFLLVPRVPIPIDQQEGV